MTPESGGECNGTTREKEAARRKPAHLKENWEALRSAAYRRVRTSPSAFADAGRWLDAEYSEGAIRERYEQRDAGSGGRVSPYQIIPPEPGRDARLARLSSAMVDLRHEPPNLSSFAIDDPCVWAHRILLLVCLLTDRSASDYTADLTELGALPWCDDGGMGRAMVAATEALERPEQSDLERGDEPWVTMVRDALRLVPDGQTGTPEGGRTNEAARAHARGGAAGSSFGFGVRSGSSRLAAARGDRQQETAMREAACAAAKCHDEEAQRDAANATPAECAAELRRIADELARVPQRPGPTRFKERAATDLLARALRFRAWQSATVERAAFRRAYFAASESALNWFVPDYHPNRFTETATMLVRRLRDEADQIVAGAEVAAASNAQQHPGEGEGESSAAADRSKSTPLADPPLPAIARPDFPLTNDLRATSDPLWQKLRMFRRWLMEGERHTPGEWHGLLIDIRHLTDAAGLLPNLSGAPLVAWMQEVKAAVPGAWDDEPEDWHYLLLTAPGTDGWSQTHNLLDCFADTSEREVAIAWAEGWMSARERQLIGTAPPALLGKEAVVAALDCPGQLNADQAAAKPPIGEKPAWRSESLSVTERITLYATAHKGDAAPSIRVLAKAIGCAPSAVQKNTVYKGWCKMSTGHRAESTGGRKRRQSSIIAADRIEREDE